MAYDCHQQVKAHDLKAFSPQELLEMKLEAKERKELQVLIRIPQIDKIGMLKIPGWSWW